MAKIRVQGGTRSTTSKSLCDSCTWATRVQGMSEQQKIVKCGDMGRFINFNVEECSAYKQFGIMSLHEMKEMALIIEVKGDSVGFYTPEKWKKKHGEVELPKEYRDNEYD